MKVSAFVGKVVSLSYKNFENKIKTENIDETELYLCNVTVEEIGRGMSRYKTYHNILIYLNKEEFDERCIEKNDRIYIGDTAKWKSTKLEYNSYKPEVIKNANKSKLKTDDNGKTFYQDLVFAYKVVCKKNDWQMETKWYDQHYCTIKDSRLKLPLEDKKQFNNLVLEFYLDYDEIDLVKDFNGTVQTLLGYSNHNKMGEKKVGVELVRDEENGCYRLTLTEDKEAVG